MDTKKIYEKINYEILKSDIIFWKMNQINSMFIVYTYRTKILQIKLKQTIYILFNTNVFLFKTLFFDMQ